MDNDIAAVNNTIVSANNLAIMFSECFVSGPRRAVCVNGDSVAFKQVREFNCRYLSDGSAQ